MKRSSQRKELPQDIGDPRLPDETYHQFRALEEAFTGILEQQLVFSTLPAGSRSLGFTTSSPELHTGRRLSYNFLHLTVQEYLAAFHISSLSSHEQMEIFGKYRSLQHLDVMWRFVAGLTKFCEVGWDLVCSHDIRTLECRMGKIEEGKDKDSVGLFLVWCLYEAQNDSL